MYNSRICSDVVLVVCYMPLSLYKMVVKVSCLSQLESLLF